MDGITDVFEDDLLLRVSLEFEGDDTPESEFQPFTKWADEVLRQSGVQRNQSEPRNLMEKGDIALMTFRWPLLCFESYM